MPARLTTSSYAVLGMLTLGPWSGYELAQQAQRSLRFVWPKSASHLYAEPKKLVDLGLATVRTEPAGESRTRQVYEITPAGREAFRDWLGTEPAPPHLEVEAMLRVFFADQGDRDELLRVLDVFEAQVQAVYQAGVTQLQRTLDGQVIYPERLHLIALYASFQGDFYRLMLNWITFARGEVSDWDTTAGIGLTERTRHLLEEVASGKSVLPQPKAD
ncbi:MAG TPA: PadR family transcriptional regulator [Acidimicrobiales bacterium]